MPPCEGFIHDTVSIVEPQGNAGDESIIPFKLWDAQRAALALVMREKRLIILKARQLGITWLIIAYCLWVCIYFPNRSVLFFSRDLDGAKEMLRRARGMFFRLLHRPVYLVRDATQELEWSNGSRIKSLAATEDAGSSYTASIIVFDECAKMRNADGAYTAAKPAVNDGGAQLIIMSTAKGKDNLFARLWVAARAGLNNFATLFIPWDARPGRDAAWYARTALDALSMARHKQEYPATEDEAFQELSDEPFIEDIALWDACRDDAMPTPEHGDTLVVALDAGVNNDSFGLVSVYPHPHIPGDICVHLALEYTPQETPSGISVVDFNLPLSMLDSLIEHYNVTQVCFDPYQLHQPMQVLRDEGRVFVSEFSQAGEREIADKQLRDLILQRRVHHNGSEVLRRHVGNADRKVTGDRKLRLIKRTQALKIDCAVCLSMAAKRLIDLGL